MSKKANPEPIAMLIEDHKKVKKLFEQYRKSEDDADKDAISEKVCAMLTVHTTLEEELFYPAARDALEEGDLVDEAEVEHDVAKSLIEQLRAGDFSDSDKRDATFEVLSEYVGHHVDEEESELFKQVRKADMDFETLAEEMRARKEELEAEHGLADEEEVDEEA